MAQYNHLPIFQLTYQLALEIHRATHQFPREYKYTLGQKLKEIVSDVLDMIVEANSAEEKTEILEGARLKLERLRIHLRLTNDLEILGLKRYEAFNRTLEEISKQLSGWLEWAKSKKSGSLKTG